MNVLVRVYGWLKLILTLVWLVFLVLLGAKLAQQNPQLMRVDLILWNTPEVSVGVILCITLLLGVVLGIAAMLPSLLLTKAKLHRAQGNVVKARKHDQLDSSSAVRGQALS